MSKKITREKLRNFKYLDKCGFFVTKDIFVVFLKYDEVYIKAFLRHIGVNYNLTDYSIMTLTYNYTLHFDFRVKRKIEYGTENGIEIWAVNSFVNSEELMDKYPLLGWENYLTISGHKMNLI